MAALITMKKGISKYAKMFYFWKKIDSCPINYKRLITDCGEEEEEERKKKKTTTTTKK